MTLCGKRSSFVAFINMSYTHMNSDLHVKIIQVTSADFSSFWIDARLP